MAELARIVISSIGLMTLASIVADWIERHALLIEIGTSFEICDHRIAWGRYWSWGDDAHRRFLVIRLPGWHWDRMDYGRLQGWCRHYLVWTDGDQLPKGWRVETAMPHAERERAMGLREKRP